MHSQISFVENTSDDPSRRRPDITKIKTTLGWEPKVPLREGLLLMVDDFKT
jgi:UDP-glucuronate decarboxylase